MRFSVDAHAIGCHLTGNEVYIRNLLHEYARLNKSDEFVAYIGKPDAPDYIPESIRTRWVSDNPYKRLALDLPRAVQTDKPDLLHVQYTGPLFTDVPLVVSVHDVSYLEHPQYFTRYRALQLRLTVKRTVEKAAAILTPSDFSRTAILRHYSIDPDKVHVVPNAVSSEFRPIERQTAQNALQKKFGLTAPFVLMVGDLQPRKNHLGLLRAFEELIGQHPHLPHHMVFVGKETWYTGEVRRAIELSSVKGRVHITGFVNDSDLVQFYGACDLFVFPSFYEGFGLPILEAMACGRAVVCSNTTAMPEVANAAGILFDPASDREMFRAMADVLLDSDLRQRLERLGANRAAQFSWEKSARMTLDVYSSIVGARSNLKNVVRAGA
jgi:glycosyltransferase involved in cell wall biosynthesis